MSICDCLKGQITYHLYFLNTAGDKVTEKFKITNEFDIVGKNPKITEVWTLLKSITGFNHNGKHGQSVMLLHRLGILAWQLSKIQTQGHNYLYFV